MPSYSKMLGKMPDVISEGVCKDCIINCIEGIIIGETPLLKNMSIYKNLVLKQRVFWIKETFFVVFHPMHYKVSLSYKG